VVTTFVNSSFFQFMVGWLFGGVPVADENRIGRTLEHKAQSQSATACQREPFRNPFRRGEDAHDWRLEVPRIGAL
jgi:hypothetical protein